MSELLSSVVGGSGDFITRSISSGSIAAGTASGVLLTVTPLAGQRVRLTHLSTEPTALAQVGITVSFDAIDVVSEGNLQGDNPAPNTFSVGRYQDYTASESPAGNHIWFTGKKGEVLTIVKNAGATNRKIFYGYELGE